MCQCSSYGIKSKTLTARLLQGGCYCTKAALACLCWESSTIGRVAISGQLTTELADAGIEQQALGGVLEQVVVHIGACNALKDLQGFLIVLQLSSQGGHLHSQPDVSDVRCSKGIERLVQCQM